MTEAMQDQDDRIKDLLRSDAPPAHDPMFRVRVMERRERMRFRNQLLLALGGGLALALVSVIGVNLGGKAFDAAGVVVVAGALAAAYALYAPQVVQLLRRFRN